MGQRRAKRRGVGLDASGSTQGIYPLAETLQRDIDQRKQRRRRRPVVLEHPVVLFFDFKREVAQLVQADHAATAFQSVKAAAHRGQRCAVVLPRFELHRAGGDGVEHFVGFGQIDIEQLGIELRGVGLEQTDGFLGRRGCRRRRPGCGDRRHRFL